jgi:hypothetical protein
MQTKLSWKTISQATATIALSISMLAAVETAKASAVTLQTFKVSGTFGDEKFVTYGTFNEYPELPEDSASNFINGSFDGTFTVDVDRLPSKDYVDLGWESFDIKLRNSSGVVVKTIGLASAREPFSSSVTPEEVFFSSNDYILFQLFVDSNFTGTSIGRPVDVGLGVPVYGAYRNQANRYDIQSRIYVTSFRSEPVPEPFTLGGTAVAGTLGLWLKRKHKTSKAV